MGYIEKVGQPPYPIIHPQTPTRLPPHRPTHLDEEMRPGEDIERVLGRVRREAPPALGALGRGAVVVLAGEGRERDG